MWACVGSDRWREAIRLNGDEGAHSLLNRCEERSPGTVASVRPLARLRTQDGRGYRLRSVRPCWRPPARLEFS
jgi:hypothetical protein